jgi:hypothetical protein
MQEHEILTASRLRWHDISNAYRAEAGAYIALITPHHEPISRLRTYRVLVAYYSLEYILAAESFNNLEDAVAWCEWKMPTTFNKPEAHTSLNTLDTCDTLDTVDGGNIWDFLRSLGITV